MLRVKYESEYLVYTLDMHPVNIHLMNSTHPPYIRTMYDWQQCVDHRLQTRLNTYTISLIVVANKAQRAYLPNRSILGDRARISVM